MIRDLFHSPPIYKAAITLSFKPKTDAKNGAAAKASGPKVGEKRKPITFSSGGGSRDAGAGGKKRQLYMDSVGSDNRGETEIERCGRR